MARDPDRYGKDDPMDYTRDWAAREFGPQHAAEIADLLKLYTRYNSRRKPEQLEPTTYRLIPGGEADEVAAAWQSLQSRAQTLNKHLPEAQRASFFELVLFPIEASANLAGCILRPGATGCMPQQVRRVPTWRRSRCGGCLHGTRN